MDVCRYWIDTFGIDGDRLDNTVNYYVPGDLRGLPDLHDGLATEGQQNFSLTRRRLLGRRHHRTAADIPIGSHWGPGASHALTRSHLCC